MIRLVIVGIGAVLSTLAGSFAASWIEAGSVGSAPAAMEVPVELVKLDVVSVPIIRDGKVQGYAVARLSVGASPEYVKSAKPLLMAYATEAAFRAIFELRLNFEALKPLEILTLANRVTELANERYSASIWVRRRAAIRMDGGGR